LKKAGTHVLLGAHFCMEAIAPKPTDTNSDNPAWSSHTSEVFYSFLAGIFLTSLTLGNVVGITKFVDLGWFVIPAGLLAYPFTFLATDLISELYGRQRAQSLVWVGFSMNVFMLILMWLGHMLPDATGVSGAATTFEQVYTYMKPNVVASMVAYLVAQSIDVQLFHFWRQLTDGRHLWLRNNGSTMLSLSILYAAGSLGKDIDSIAKLIPLALSSYAFKLVFALLDTPLFYAGVYALRDRVTTDNRQLD
jgi:uncharacterized integral membrane protein (TIGR00697 family)